MVSVDTLEDNKAFAEKEQADFTMLANPDKKVAFAYGVIAPDAPPIGSSRAAGRSTSIPPARLRDRQGREAGRPRARTSSPS